MFIITLVTIVVTLFFMVLSRKCTKVSHGNSNVTFLYSVLCKVVS